MVLHSNLYGNSFYFMEHTDGDVWLSVEMEAGTYNHFMIHQGTNIHYEKRNKYGQIDNRYLPVPKEFQDRRWEIVSNDALDGFTDRRVLLLHGKDLKS